MSNLGFSVEGHYAASRNLRRPRAIAPRTDESSRRFLQAKPRTPYALYFVFATALVLPTAYAFPEQAAVVLHHFGAL